MHATPDVIAAVHEMLAAITNILHARDPEAAMALFAPDAAIIVASAEREPIARGPAEIGAFLEEFFREPFTLRCRWDDVRASASGSVAWVFAEGESIRTWDDGEVTRALYLATIVMERFDGKWFIQHYHGSRPVPKGTHGRD